LKNKSENIKNFIGRLSSEFFSNTAVEIHVSGIVYVTGCKKITSYTDTEIEMKCTDATVTFEGNGLRLENLINGQICVKGKVFGVNFSYD